MYIVFEGLDWAWKDTQLQNIFKFLSEEFKYMNILKTQEPSGISETGKEISRKLKNEGFKSPEEALNLYIKDRVEMSDIKKWNIKYGTVLCSRWDYTTYAYQSLDQWDNKWFSFDEIHRKHKELENSDNPLLLPDLTFYFDLPIEETMNRINNRLKDGEKRDFFEKKDFLEKARTQYLEAIKYLETKEWRNIIIIDATKTREEIFEELKKHLLNFINNK